MADMREIKEQLSKIDERLDGIEKIQAEQSVDLRHHIKRTDALQDMVEPIFKLKYQVVGVLKFLSAIALIGGLVKLIVFWKT